MTLGRPVFDNSTNDLQYEVTFVPNMRHPSKTARFLQAPCKCHWLAKGASQPKHSCPSIQLSSHAQNARWIS